MLRAVPHGPVTELRMASAYLGQALYWASAYYFNGVLVDSGPPRTAPQLAAWMSGRPLQMVLNTHSHEDHVGGDDALPLTPLAPQASLERMAHPPRIQLFRRLAWGRARPIAAQPLPEWVETDDGRLEVVPTPGHSDDLVIFVDPDRGWAFTGDLFISERIRYAQADENALQSMQSIRRALNEDFETLYCGHSGCVPDGKTALRRKLQWLEDVRGEAIALLGQGLGPKDIARRVFGGLGRWHWITRGWFSEVNLIRQLLGDQHVG